MQWLVEIFSDTSDKARLVTTLIAASIAIGVVLINQWFNMRRSRKEKLFEKVEELYLSMIEMEEVAISLHNEITLNYSPSEHIPKSNPYEIFESPRSSKMKGSIEELNNEFYKVEAKSYMLSKLYFPSVSEDIENIKNNYQLLYIEYTVSNGIEEYIAASKKYGAEISVTLKIIYKKLSSIMTKI